MKKRGTKKKKGHQPPYLPFLASLLSTPTGAPGVQAGAPSDQPAVPPAPIEAPPTALVPMVDNEDPNYVPMVDKAMALGGAGKKAAAKAVGLESSV